MAAEKCYGRSRSAHSGCSARPMRVCQRPIREIVIDNVRYVAEIQPPACDARRHHQPYLLLLEAIEKRRASGLFEPAVYYINRIHFLLEMAEQFFAAGSR